MQKKPISIGLARFHRENPASGGEKCRAKSGSLREFRVQAVRPSLCRNFRYQAKALREFLGKYLAFAPDLKKDASVENYL